MNVATSMATTGPAEFEGFASSDGPFRPRERELYQRLIGDWIERNRLPDVGFDIAVCLYQERGDGFREPQAIAAVCSLARGSSPADMREFEAEKVALRSALLAYTLSVDNKSDIYCVRMRDDYRSQPLVLVLNSETGRFLICLTTWFNYTSVGKTMRFLEFAGNLLCQMRAHDQVLAESFAKAFGMMRVSPEGQGDTPMFCPELPVL